MRPHAHVHGHAVHTIHIKTHTRHVASMFYLPSVLFSHVDILELEASQQQ